MLVELAVTSRSHIDDRRWFEIKHLARTWEHTGPRDIIVVGEIAVLREALTAAGIDHVVRARVCVTPQAFRVDIVELGARVRIRRAGDVIQAAQIADSRGVRVVVDDAASSPGR